MVVYHEHPEATPFADGGAYGEMTDDGHVTQQRTQLRAFLAKPTDVFERDFGATPMAYPKDEYARIGRDRWLGQDASLTVYKPRYQI